MRNRLTVINCRLFGFFLGSTLTGAGIYYYVLDEYKVSNELLTEDIYVRHELPRFTPFSSSTGVGVRSHDKPLAHGSQQTATLSA